MRHHAEANRLEVVAERSSENFRNSLRVLFLSRSYTILLLTSWVNSTFSAIWYFFNLYIRALEWDFILIGSILSFTAIIGVLMQLVGGYIGDIIDRKKLAVAAFVVLALYHIIIGLFDDIIPITVALIILSFFEVVKNGSTALIMENIPREQSGLGLSLYPVGRIFGIVALSLFAFIIPLE